MRKILMVVFCLLAIVAFATQSYADGLNASLGNNFYNSGRLEDSSMISVKLEYNNLFIFQSYERANIRLLGYDVGDYKMFGVGVGYYNYLLPCLRMRFSAGYYMPDVGVLYDSGTAYNKGIHLYLNSLAARFPAPVAALSPYDRLFDYYHIAAEPALGINIGMEFVKNTNNPILSAHFGYRLLKVPITISGHDVGPNSIAPWSVDEDEDFSCLFVGFSIGVMF